MTTTPELLRDQGMAAAERAAIPDDVTLIDRLIDEANASGEPWSANDIRAGMPPGLGQGLVGARVRAAAARRPAEMVAVGYVASDLASTHAHPIRLWSGIAAFAASA